MDNFENYIMYINGLLNVAGIGFIIHFSLFMKSVFKEKEDVLQKRLDAFDEELQRTEKWADRNQEKLKHEKDALQKQLDKLLIDANIDIQSFNLIDSVQKIDSKLKLSLKEISEKIEELELKPKKLNTGLSISMAKAYASNEEWFKAATQYDIATKDIPNNWELYFYKGVAFANSRKGRESYLKSLQAYSDAIVYLPSDADSNLKARLFIYKGAMLKRLNRLDEAKISINLGLSYAKNNYEINDALYNLGCIYAMKDEKDKFEEVANKLQNKSIKMYEYLLSRVKEYAPDFCSSS